MAAQLPISRGLVAFRQLPGLLHHLAPSSAFPSRLLPAAVLPATTLFANVSDVISTIWESILRAVPKKRSSYSKKRSRQMAGKGLKDLINLNRCSSCGRTKRMHVLCPYCVQNIKDMWAGRLTEPMNSNKDRYGDEKTMEMTTTAKSK